MANAEICERIRFKLRKTLILSILTYSIRLFPISESIIAKPESTCSKRQRRALIGPYNPGNDRITNIDIRRKFNTPFPKSLLYVRYIKIICTCGTTNSCAYLDNKTEHDDSDQFGRQIYAFVSLLKNYNNDNCICNSHTSCILHNRLILHNAQKREKIY